MNKKYFNKKLLTVGAGSLLAMLGGGMLASTLAGKTKGYNEEIAGGLLTVGGSMLLAQKDKNIKNVGMGMGSVGVALAGKSLYQRITGNQGLLPDGSNGSSNGSNSNGENSDSPTYDIPDGYQIV